MLNQNDAAPTAGTSPVPGQRAVKTSKSEFWSQGPRRTGREKNHSHRRLTGPSEVQQASMIMLILQMPPLKVHKSLLNTYYVPDTLT